MTRLSLQDIARPHSRVANYAGGAGFKTSINSKSNVVGPFANNVPGETDLGVGIWEPRTNLLRQSENPSSSGPWTLLVTTSGIISDSLVPAPDGAQTAKRFTPAAVSGSHGIEQNFTPLMQPGVTHTLSIFARFAGYKRLRFFFGGTGAGAHFNVEDGTIMSGAGSGAKIEPAGNGWYRCSFPYTQPTAASGSIRFYVVSDAGADSWLPDGVGGMDLWGAQLEQGAFASPYIPTTSVAGVRTADTLVYNDATPLLTPPFTAFVEAELPPIEDTNRYLLTLSASGSQNDRIRLWRLANNSIQANSIIGGVSTAIYTVNGYTGQRRVKLALRVRATTQQAAIDGVLGSLVTVNPPPGLNTINVGVANGAASGWLNGYVRKLRILPDVTDAQLQALTSYSSLFSGDFTI